MTLAERFEQAVRQVGGDRSTEGIFAELEARYAEPHRHYHTMAHVAACLSWLERLDHEAERPAELSLALFFHDAVYDRRPDDEERSARLADETLRALGAPAEVAARVAELVRTTAAHQAGEGDAALLSDIDMSILAAPPDVYARYAAGVRAEHADVGDELFRRGRSAFLREMLSRIALFATPSFRSLETAARANLADELRRLNP